jgi:hypothetical protein
VSLEIVYVFHVMGEGDAKLKRGSREIIYFPQPILAILNGLDNVEEDMIATHLQCIAEVVKEMEKTLTRMHGKFLCGWMVLKSFIRHKQALAMLLPTPHFC